MNRLDVLRAAGLVTLSVATASAFSADKTTKAEAEAVKFRNPTNDKIQSRINDVERLGDTLIGSGVFLDLEAVSLSSMPALHVITRRLVVANARHSPRYGSALRLDPTGSDAPFGHGRKTRSL